MGKDAATSNTFAAVMSCMAYSVMSNCMVLANRTIVGGKYYGFQEKTFVLAIQGVVAIIALECMKANGTIQYEKFSIEVAKKWLPVSFFFVAMLYTSTQATSGLPIHIVTVFKNITNIAIVSGEKVLFGEKVTFLVVGSLVVMLIGALMASYSDVGGKPDASPLIGYIWMLLNCMCTASYVLYMRYATTYSSLKLSRFGMAFYNNICSLVLLTPGMLFSGELFSVWRNPLLTNVSFMAVLIFSGFVGIALSLSSFWCISVTTATTYATVGALNKIPTTFIGVLLLGEILKPTTAIYVSFGMAGGMMYAYAKFKEKQEAKELAKKLKEEEENQKLMEQNV